MAETQEGEKVRWGENIDFFSLQGRWEPWRAVTWLRFYHVPSGGCGENGLQGARKEAGRRLLQ